jgi:hypothetical protein
VAGDADIDRLYGDAGADLFYSDLLFAPVSGQSYDSILAGSFWRQRVNP